MKNIEELKKYIFDNKKVKIKVKVIASSKINSIEFADDIIKIKIKEKALDGKANKALIEFLSEILKIKKSNLTILSGRLSPLKIIQICI